MATIISERRASPGEAWQGMARFGKVGTGLGHMIETGFTEGPTNVMSTTTTARESRLRRALAKHGAILRKSRSRTWTVDNHQGYMIIDADRNAVLAGSRFDLTLDDVDAWTKG